MYNFEIERDKTSVIFSWTDRHGNESKLRLTPYLEAGDLGFDLYSFNQGCPEEATFTNIDAEIAAALIAYLVERFGFDPMVSAALP